MYSIPYGQTKLRLRGHADENLSSVSSVKLRIYKPNKTSYFVDAVIETPMTDEGWFYYDIISTDFTEIGAYQYTVWKTYPDTEDAISDPIGLTVDNEFEICTNVI